MFGVWPDPAAFQSSHAVKHWATRCGLTSDFLADTTAAINGSNSASGGVKARFTHPGLSSDGMGRYLGRLTNAQTVGDQVFADLHFAEAATKTPDGNLADYVMTLAAEDPEAFGLSIVFEHDVEASEDRTTRSTRTTGDLSRRTKTNKDNFASTHGFATSASR
jgi:hypothetical protein